MPCRPCSSLIWVCIHICQAGAPNLAQARKAACARRDFRLKNVASINASGHKFGLVYPGVGWCIFRSKAFLPESLVFHDNYLGTDQISFTLNFSKGASQMRPCLADM